ncbi:hypothetical protein [Halothiobacillus sp.]|uniref:hypothetical protein n=1 Tax=Halothiobacillus sp. TaxID=1891311 RepID=UPI002602D68F|nr:hypothetical protein [Halothiobacillus sp.]MDD4965488.1 hypothetical protein [Halothiobacillus sp.]
MNPSCYAGWRLLRIKLAKPAELLIQKPQNEAEAAVRSLRYDAKADNEVLLLLGSNPHGTGF